MTRITDPPVTIDLGGNYFKLRVTEELPHDESGRTCRMFIDGDKRVIWFHKSVPPGERAAWLAEAAGFDPAGVTWRLCPAGQPASRPLPMLTISD